MFSSKGKFLLKNKVFNVLGLYLHSVSILRVVLEDRRFTVRCSGLWRPVTPTCVDTTATRFPDAGQLVPHRVVVHSGVGAVAHH